MTIFHRWCPIMLLGLQSRNVTTWMYQVKPLLLLGFILYLGRIQSLFSGGESRLISLSKSEMTLWGMRPEAWIIRCWSSICLKLINQIKIGAVSFYLLEDNNGDMLQRAGRENAHKNFVGSASLVATLDYHCGALFVWTSQHYWSSINSLTIVK